MIASIQEHNKEHLLLDSAVVLFKEQLNLSLELLQVLNLSVNANINIDTVHEVGKEKSLGVENKFLLDAEVLDRFF